VQLTRAAGFDSIKIDHCGPWINISTYYELSRPLMLEVNPWMPSRDDRYKPVKYGPGYGPPDDKWCPFNMFRASTDLKNTWASIWHNLQSMQPFSNISRPGCWAYADMLMVGKLASAVEDRAHFSAWFITSSPLIMGHRATDEAVNEKVWKVVNNPLAIAINQQWAGHAGAMVKEGPSRVQLWAKPLLGGDIAVMLINGGDKKVVNAKVDIDAAQRRFGRPVAQIYAITDVWSRANSTRGADLREHVHRLAPRARRSFLRR
jgi:hypothetical protein